jgi:Putative serine esterase (DUF676)
LCIQVEDVVEENFGLTKISFLAHSLGGLFTRYAVAVLYSSDDQTMGKNVTSQDTKTDDSTGVSRSGLIAGLEPINFITLATPHLGVRGNKQVGLHILPCTCTVSNGSQTVICLCPSFNLCSHNAYYIGTV